VLPLGQKLSFNRKFLRRGCSVTSLLKHHSMCSIEKIRTCNCFVNKSTAKGDQDLMFSLLHTRNSKVWKYAQTWLVCFLIDRISVYFHGHSYSFDQVSNQVFNENVSKRWQLSKRSLFMPNWCRNDSKRSPKGFIEIFSKRLFKVI